MQKKCVNCFKILGTGSRAKIYMYLSLNGSKNVSEITEFIKLKQPTVSYHLSELEKVGLLDKKKNGQETFYSVNMNCPHSEDEKECIVVN